MVGIIRKKTDFENKFSKFSELQVVATVVVYILPEQILFIKQDKIGICSLQTEQTINNIKRATLPWIEDN